MLSLPSFLAVAVMLGRASLEFGSLFDSNSRLSIGSPFLSEPPATNVVRSPVLPGAHGGVGSGSLLIGSSLNDAVSRPAAFFTTTGALAPPTGLRPKIEPQSGAAAAP